MGRFCNRRFAGAIICDARQGLIDMGGHIKVQHGQTDTGDVDRFFLSDFEESKIAVTDRMPSTDPDCSSVVPFREK